MSQTETITILRQFNEWRRGDEDIPQFDPNKIGAAIDAAVEMIDRLDAAEKERDALRTNLDDYRALVFVLRKEVEKLRAKIAEMERQEPASPVPATGYSNQFPLYALPGAQQPTPHAFDDSATIAGLQSAVSHLSALFDEFRALLVEVDDVCGRDGHGGPLEYGESEIIDKVRAALSMTEASPQPESSVPDVDALAQFIREVDGSHQLGAGVLAERIVEWLAATPEVKP